MNYPAFNDLEFCIKIQNEKITKIKDITDLIKDCTESYLLEKSDNTLGIIDFLMEEIKIRTGKEYELCCECGICIPFDRLEDHPVLCTQKETKE